MAVICQYTKGILRGPEELKEIYEDYREKVGTLSKVVGGICTIDSVCPTKMACVGCAAKVSRPKFKDEITAYYNWAYESEKRFEKLGLPLMARKMKISKNRARNELKEIQLVDTNSTKNINQRFISTNSNELKWLSEIYDKRKMRSYSLGVEAIDSLLKEGKKVSYRSVAMNSKDLDPEGKGIHSNTIKGNEQLYSYYLQHSSVKISTVKMRNRSPIVISDSLFRNIKLGRDIDS
ncbi:hypothetical protein [Paenibacillus uliginis]|uniref:hypothetical protein n=1 Tax=Paenibacillus uliginis TaxID=683737 RepID=UPI001AD83669|nr:hypothetical protein [Paenibacillus uliginis]